MAKTIKLYASPEVYRQTVLSVERYDAEVGMSVHNNQPFIVNGTMGVGKTEGLLAYLRSKLWRVFCAGVVLFFYTHRQLDEIEKKLAGSGLVVRRYPQRDGKRCGVNDAEMTFYENLKLPLLAKVEVCGECPAQDGCPYLERSKKTWAKGADVILAPEQLVGVFPGVLRRWAGAMNRPRETKPLLTAFDEVKIADNGFYREFTQANLEREARAASSSTFYAVADFLRALSKRPTATDLTIPLIDRKDRIRIQRRGVDLFSEKYTSVLDLAEDYVRRPVWFEDGTYCVALYPTLPPTTLFLGAFLDPTYIARRMGVPVPRVMGDDSVVLHPESLIVNVASAVGFRMYWPNNKAAIINLAADLIARNHAAGKTTIVIGRKNGEDGGDA